MTASGSGIGTGLSLKKFSGWPQRWNGFSGSSRSWSDQHVDGSLASTRLVAARVSRTQNVGIAHRAEATAIATSSRNFAGSSQQSEAWMINTSESARAIARLSAVILFQRGESLASSKIGHS